MIPAMGTATLSNGSVTVLERNVTDGMVLLLQRKRARGSLGELGYSIDTGVSFTITSLNILDQSDVGWVIVI
jgi:hypothetical protein